MGAWAEARDVADPCHDPVIGDTGRQPPCLPPDRDVECTGGESRGSIRKLSELVEDVSCSRGNAYYMFP